MEFVVLIWIGLGIIGHIRQSNEMVTWCGTPVWEEVSTYLMFFPAMLAGPLTLILFEECPEKHPERKNPPR